MEIDPAALDKVAAYRLMTSILVPRPIAWVGSVDEAGRDNLAPFSYFMGVGSAPPMLAISVARGRRGMLKDTARNLLATGEFTVSIVERPLLEAANLSSGAWEESEFDVAGLERGRSSTIRAPYVSAARVAMECRLRHTLDLGQTHLFVGEVVRFHVDDALLHDGAVPPEAWQPMARLGGDHYATLGEILTLPRVKPPQG